MGKRWHYKTSSPLVLQNLGCDLGMVGLKVRWGRVGNGELGPLAKGGQETPRVEADRKPTLRETFHQGLDSLFENRLHPLTTSPHTSFSKTPPLLDQNRPLRNHFPQSPKEANPDLLDANPLPSRSLNSPLAQPTSLCFQPFPL